MSHSYPSPPHSNSDHGSFRDINELFDTAAFDDAIRHSSGTASAERPDLSDQPSNSDPDQVSNDISHNDRESHRYVTDHIQVAAAITDSANHTNFSEESMAELLEQFLDQDRLEGLSATQDGQCPGSTEKNSSDRVLRRPKCAHQWLKRSRSEDLNLLLSTCVKRVRSNAYLPKRSFRQFYPQGQRLQAPDHAHGPLPWSARTSESYTFPLPTNDEASNTSFDYWGAAHQEHLSMPIPQSEFGNEDLGQVPLQADVPELITLVMPDTTNGLVPYDWQEAFPVRSSSNAYEPNAPPTINANAAEQSCHIFAPYFAPTITHDPSQEPTDNNSAECMCCNALTHKSGKPAYFRVKAAALPLCGHFVCQTCITQYYGFKGQYNSCIYCPICDDFSGSLAISDASLPTLSRDLHYLLYASRQLPQSYFF